MIKKDLQIKIVLYFLSIAAVILAIYTTGIIGLILFSVYSPLRLSLSQIFLLNVGVSFIVIIFLGIFLGLKGTHRFAGALFRIERHLLKMADGDISEDIIQRKGDLLEDFVQKFNTALRGQREMIYRDRMQIEALKIEVQGLKDFLKEEAHERIDHIVAALDELTSSFAIQPLEEVKPPEKGS
jgi:hypothetical protein